MNRTVKFRGKSIDDNQWMYGDISFNNEYRDPFIAPPELGVYQVHKESIGEYVFTTGKGQDVYEGDVVRYDTEDGICTALVYFKDNESESEWLSGFALKPIGNIEEYEDDNPVEFHVIGNIHDNPELLK
jgi:hypothetical protein